MMPEEDAMTDKHVLVIDDEQVILDSVSRILTEEGFTVDTAIDSRRGLERALDGGYDLVLTDIRMPEIGGMRILRDIKRANPGVPVIIFTGYATVQSAVQAMKLGAADYVEKPFTPDALVNTVMAAIEKASEEEPEEQGLVNRSQVIEVLDRAAVDGDFLVKLLYEGADALES